MAGLTGKAAAATGKKLVGSTFCVVGTRGTDGRAGGMKDNCAEFDKLFLWRFR